MFNSGKVLWASGVMMGLSVQETEYAAFQLSFGVVLLALYFIDEYA